MIGFGVERPRDGRLRLLFLGAHADDIEIGCGGTALRLLGSGARAHVWWGVLGATGQREREARASAAAFLKGAAERRVEVCGFRDGFFPSQHAAIKERLEEWKRAFEPDLVFTHARHDLHQDHRITCELTWNTFRDHAILEYEIPKYDGDLGAPNLFVPLDERTCRRKIALLSRHFPSQRRKRWFTEETFRALLRLRGVEAGGRAAYAEAFFARKVTWSAPFATRGAAR